MVMNKRVLAAALWAALGTAPLMLTASDDPPADSAATYRVVVAEGSDDRSVAEPPGVWLGISLKEVEGDLADYLNIHEGVLVKAVFPNSPAGAAKLQVGDIIVSFDGNKVEDPKALIDALRKFGKTHAAKGEADKFPSVELKVMRRGKEIAVNVKPTTPPQTANNPSAPNDGAKLADEVASEVVELENVLKDLQTQGEAKVLRFGPPVTFERRLLHGPHHHEARNFVIIMKDEDDKATEVRIESVGDEPPKITLKEGDKTRQITKAEIDQLPERLRKTISDALKQIEAKPAPESAAQSAEREAKRREIIAEVHKNIEKNAELQDRLRRLGEGPRVRVVGPDGPVNLSASAEELAAKFRVLAEEMARRGAKNVQEFAAMPEQLQQLRMQIDELKQQVAELKAELRKDKQ